MSDFETRFSPEEAPSVPEEAPSASETLGAVAEAFARPGNAEHLAFPDVAQFVRSLEGVRQEITAPVMDFLRASERGDLALGSGSTNPGPIILDAPGHDFALGSGSANPGPIILDGPSQAA